VGILFTFWWMVWKERNKHIFEGVECSALGLAPLTRDVIQLQCLARMTDAPVALSA
jgi:hypothetical protein